MRDRPLSQRQQAANTTRSKVRARVEHVFADQENGMGGKIVRTMGIARARVKIGAASFGSSGWRPRPLELRSREEPVCSGVNRLRSYAERKETGRYPLPPTQPRTDDEYRTMASTIDPLAGSVRRRQWHSRTLRGQDARVAVREMAPSYCAWVHALACARTYQRATSERPSIMATGGDQPSRVRIGD